MSVEINSSEQLQIYLEKYYSNFRKDKNGKWPKNPFINLRSKNEDINLVIAFAKGKNKINTIPEFFMLYKIIHKLNIIGYAATNIKIFDLIQNLKDENKIPTFTEDFSDDWCVEQFPTYGYIYGILMDCLLLELGYYIYPKKNIGDNLYSNNANPFVFYGLYYSENILELVNFGENGVKFYDNFLKLLRPKQEKINLAVYVLDNKHNVDNISDLFKIYKRILKNNIMIIDKVIRNVDITNLIQKLNLPSYVNASDTGEVYSECYEICECQYGYVYCILIDHLLLKLGYYIYPKLSTFDNLYKYSEGNILLILYNNNIDYTHNSKDIIMDNKYINGVYYYDIVLKAIQEYDSIEK